MGLGKTKPKQDKALGHRKPKAGRGGKIPAETWDAFLEHVAKCANITMSCEAVGISREAFYKRKWSEDDEDREFMKRFQKAWDDGYDALEEECRRRAFAGYDKPVFQGGRKVGVIREYSDGLAQFLMKGNKPKKFAERSVVTTNEGGPGGRFSDLKPEELDALIKRETLRGGK